MSDILLPLNPHDSFKIMVPYEKRPSGLYRVRIPDEEPTGLKALLAKFIPQKPRFIRLDERGSIIWEIMVQGGTFAKILDSLKEHDDSTDLEQRTVWYIRTLEHQGIIRVISQSPQDV